MLKQSLSVVLAVSVSLIAETNCRLIGSQLARKLVHQAVVTLGVDAKGFVLIPYVNDSAPDFHSFEALLQNSSTSGRIGFFAVNPWTGDVWNIDRCSRIISSELKKEQESILERSGMSALAATTLRERPPRCRPD